VQYQPEQEQQNMIPGPIASRLGPRSLTPDDTRFKLDRIYQTELVERQGAPGPMCFGPRIMGELVLLGDGARKYAVACSCRGSRRPCAW
jgi:hypothetical protein